MYWEDWGERKVYKKHEWVLYHPCLDIWMRGFTYGQVTSVHKDGTVYTRPGACKSTRMRVRVHVDNLRPEHPY